MLLCPPPIKLYAADAVFNVPPTIDEMLPLTRFLHPPPIEDKVPVFVCEVPIVALDPTVNVVPSYVKFVLAHADTVDVPFAVNILFVFGFIIALNPIPLEPDVPDEPLVPELPLEPEVPDSPDEPDVPLEPDVPDEPLVPELPLEPLVPELPLEPLVPDSPDEPDVPLEPDVPDEPLVPELPLEPLVPDSPDEPDVPDDPLVPLSPLEPEVPDSPDEPDVPEEPLVPELPLEPLVPDSPDEPDVPEEPEVPEEPSSPLSPTKAKETIISSSLVNGDAADDACSFIFIVQYVPKSVRSDIENNIKFSAANLSAILIWPFTAEVEASILSKNSCISSPSSVVWLIIDNVEAF